MGKVFITDYITDPAIETDILGKIASDPNDPQIEVLLVWHKDVNKEYLSQFKNLKGMIRYGVGTDNLDFKEAKRRNLYICNTPDYGIDEVSDTTIAMIMNFTRGIQEYDIFSKKISDNSWQENINPKKKRSSSIVIGVLGAGRIGSSVLLKARSIGFKTIYYDPYKEQGHDKVVSAKSCDTIEEFLKLADIISINAKLNNETNSLVNKNFIKKMKKDSYLINTARGKIVEDLDHFIDPIKSGKISGIALDVLPDEPPSKDSLLIKSWKNNEEWVLGKVMINPHTGYYSQEAYFEMRQKAAQNAKRIIQNLKPYSIVLDIDNK